MEIELIICMFYFKCHLFYAVLQKILLVLKVFRHLGGKQQVQSVFQMFGLLGAKHPSCGLFEEQKESHIFVSLIF